MDKLKSELEEQLINIDHDDVITEKELFIASQNNCPLCGHELVLSHRSKYVTNQIHEEAECSTCNIRLRNEEHKIH